MAVDFKDRETWTRIGYVLSVIWMVGVLVVSGGKATHPAFDYIFIVPLVGWILGLLIARFIWRGPSRPG
ncbi:MAG: hypothetical protein OEQ29_11900 [Alphaproteobacteria bacterium]|nr:hypothetical protein [Alphaproteobacteria bacterium]